MSLPLARPPEGQTLLARAIESDCSYFEMAAQVRRLDGAIMAWMPGLAASPAAAVLHRVDPDAVADGGAGWLARAEADMATIGATLCRMYLDGGHDRASAVLEGAGYVARDELVFLDLLPDPSLTLILRPVVTAEDWAAKLRFHRAADETPDGHGNLPADWVELERRKCGAGMQAYLAELDGEVVGAIGAIWCDDFVRAKNLIVARHRRRRGIGRAIICGLAALGRKRGLAQQCFLAVRGDEGERLYRGLGMNMIGKQVEWSRPLAGRAG